jgi:hypothetical protein
LFKVKDSALKTGYFGINFKNFVIDTQWQWGFHDQKPYISYCKHKTLLHILGLPILPTNYRLKTPNSYFENHRDPDPTGSHNKNVPL